MVSILTIKKVKTGLYWWWDEKEKEPRKQIHEYKDMIEQGSSTEGQREERTIVKNI